MIARLRVSVSAGLRSPAAEGGKAEQALTEAAPEWELICVPGWKRRLAFGPRWRDACSDSCRQVADPAGVIVL
jgi:hypothetical protein